MTFSIRICSYCRAVTIIIMITIMVIIMIIIIIFSAVWFGFNLVFLHWNFDFCCYCCRCGVILPVLRSTRSHRDRFIGFEWRNFIVARPSYQFISMPVPSVSIDWLIDFNRWQLMAADGNWNWLCFFFFGFFWGFLFCFVFGSGFSSRFCLFG